MKKHHHRIPLRKAPLHESHDQQDRYLLTYADMITLLLGLFVILYASSQTDSARFKEVASAMNVYFKTAQKDSLQKPSALSGGDGILSGRQGVPNPLYKQNGDGGKTKSNDEIEADMRTALGTVLQDGSADVVRVPEGIMIRLGEALLFESGQSLLRKSAVTMIDSLAYALQPISYQRSIIFTGHTDSINIRTFQFESNWHLSSARALSVAYACMERGVYEKFIEVQGVGSQQPIADNATLEGRTRNRRVEILIRDIPAQRPTTNGYVNSP
jgi:chemotaxis protein MotB